MLFALRTKTRQLEFVDEERTIQPQMIGRTDGDRGKSLRVLVLRVHTFCKKVVERFEECEGDEELCLNIPFGIDDRVTKAELNVFAGHESEHIRRHEFILRTILTLIHIFLLPLDVVIG